MLGTLLGKSTIWRTWLMRMRHRGTCAAVLILSFLTACGRDTTGLPTSNAPLTARIDGSVWAAGNLNVFAVADPGGIYSLVGTSPDGRTIGITFYSIRGAGTYPLGVTSSVVGGVAQYADEAIVWATPASGEAGTGTITELSPTRIAGTFEFTATLALGVSATQTHTITDGTFDLDLETGGSLPIVPDDAGSVITATVEGAAFNAAAVYATTSSAGNGVGFDALNLVYGLGVSLAGVAAAGTYSLDHAAGRRFAVGGPNGGTADPKCCWGSGASDVGTITITSLTAARMQGTFDATLQPVAGSQQTQPLVITNGTFDVGR
jgi:hypothetical protein